MTVIMSVSINAKTSPIWGDLQKGVHAIGFKVIYATDYSRGADKTYNDMGDRIKVDAFSLVQINLWYPAKKSRKDRMKVLDYIYKANQVKSSKDLSNQEKKDIEEKVFAWNKSFTNEVEKQAIFSTRTQAQFYAKAKKGSFPIITYLAGTSDGNYVIAEYLASHGFIVISVPSSDSVGNLFSYSEGWAAQINDTQFALNHLHGKINADYENIGVVGASHGGIIAPFLQIQNPSIKGVISLDGMEIWEMYKDTYKAFPYKNFKNSNVPYVVFQSKLPASLVDYGFYDHLKYADKTIIKGIDFSHADYSALSIAMYDKIAPSFYKGEKELDNSIKLVGEYLLSFFKLHLSADINAQTTLDSYENINNVTIEKTAALPVPVNKK